MILPSLTTTICRSARFLPLVSIVPGDRRIAFMLAFVDHAFNSTLLILDSSTILAYPHGQAHLSLHTVPITFWRAALIRPPQDTWPRSSSVHLRYDLPYLLCAPLPRPPNSQLLLRGSRIVS